MFFLGFLFGVVIGIGLAVLYFVFDEDTSVVKHKGDEKVDLGSSTEARSMYRRPESRMPMPDEDFGDEGSEHV